MSGGEIVGPILQGVADIASVGTQYAQIAQNRRKREQEQAQFEEEMKLKNKQFSLQSLLTSAQLRQQERENDWQNKLRYYMLKGGY